MEVQISRKIFNPVYFPYLTLKTRVQIYFGGASSGKSRFLAQRCVYDMLVGGRNYLIVRKVAGTIRRSCFNEILKTINDWGVKEQFSVNQSDLIITCKNGYQMMFAGLDDVEKIKSITPAQGPLTDIWIEEATEAEPDDVKQLEKRLRGWSKFCKRVTLSFNPIVKTHWIFAKYFHGWTDEMKEMSKTDLFVLKTTYKDNKFLAPDDIKAMENETDKYYYEVYSLGNWGMLGGVIFKNWKVQDLSEIKSTFDNYYNGCDFGYANDPASIIRLHYDAKHKRIYVTDEHYETGLTNEDLAKEIKRICGKSDVVTCDSSEPKSVAELIQHGVTAVGAVKGKDSVNFGIQWLQQHEIILDVNCTRLKSELEVYKWQEDKNGSQLPKPVDRNNHGIDAMRYATESLMGQVFRDYQPEVKKKRDPWAEDYEELNSSWMAE